MVFEGVPSTSSSPVRVCESLLCFQQLVKSNWTTCKNQVWERQQIISEGGKMPKQLQSQIPRHKQNKPKQRFLSKQKHKQHTSSIIPTMGLNYQHNEPVAFLLYCTVTVVLAFFWFCQLVIFLEFTLVPTSALIPFSGC